MYFDIKPKVNRQDLFGEGYQLELLKKYIKDNNVRIIVIKGLRRTGKTSLLNVALNEIEKEMKAKKYGEKIESIKIDVRESPFYDRNEFLKFLMKHINEKLEGFFEKIVKSIHSLGIKYEKISLELFFSKEKNLDFFFEHLNTQLRNDRKFLIIALDEAQLLMNIKFDYMLASIFDNYDHIRVILTGSEIGVLDELLGRRREAPLFGRAYLEIKIEKLKEQEAMKFLEEGFKQIKKEITFEEMHETIERFDGTIGWLTYYGWLRYKGLSHKKAIEEVEKIGKKLVNDEIENFLMNRKAKANYMKVIRYLKKGYNTWSLLKQAFRKDGVSIGDGQLNLYLKELMDYGFIEKIGKRYFPSDPLI